MFAVLAGTLYAPGLGASQSVETEELVSSGSETETAGTENADASAGSSGSHSDGQAENEGPESAGAAPPGDAAEAEAEAVVSGETAETETEAGKRVKPLDCLGLTLEQAFDLFGPPEELFVQRGEQAWQDDVVFYYSDNMYLFWFDNRVWQVRLDHRYRRQVLGVNLGDSRERIREVFGEPLRTIENSEYHDIFEGDYPLRARLVFEKGKLEDLYIFRRDF